MSYDTQRILDRMLALGCNRCDMTAEEIRRIRRSMGLTQQDFAAKLGVSFAAVNRWEKGRNEPQLDRVTRIREMHAEYLARGHTTDRAKGVVTKPPLLDFEGDPEAIK